MMAILNRSIARAKGLDRINLPPPKPSRHIPDRSGGENDPRDPTQNTTWSGVSAVDTPPGRAPSLKTPWPGPSSLASFALSAYNPRRQYALLGAWKPHYDGRCRPKRHRNPSGQWPGACDVCPGAPVLKVTGSVRNGFPTPGLGSRD